MSGRRQIATDAPRLDLAWIAHVVDLPKNQIVSGGGPFLPQLSSGIPPSIALAHLSKTTRVELL